MATTVTRYVDPDADTGGDGTTNSLTGSNCAYKSLNACLTANAKNLVTADEIFEVICESNGMGHSADSTAVTVSTSWTTDATRYVSIKTSSSARHFGKWNTSKYRLAAAFTTRRHTRVEGLQIEGTVLMDSACPEFRSIKCIVRGYMTLAPYSAGGNAYVINSVIYGTKVGEGTLYFFELGSGKLYVYSSTVINTSYPAIHVVSATNCVAKNTYAAATGGNCYEGSILKTTAASSDATGSASLQNIAYSSANFRNVTSGQEDLRLATGSVLIDVGTNTSGEAAPFNFTDDINGFTRSGTWDVGADEYEAPVTVYYPLPISFPTEHV